MVHLTHLLVTSGVSGSYPETAISMLCNVKNALFCGLLFLETVLRFVEHTTKYKRIQNEGFSVQQLLILIICIVIYTYN